MRPNRSIKLGQVPWPGASRSATSPSSPLSTKRRAFLIHSAWSEAEQGAGRAHATHEYKPASRHTRPRHAPREEQRRRQRPQRGASGQRVMMFCGHGAARQRAAPLATRAARPRARPLRRRRAAACDGALASASPTTQKMLAGMPDVSAASAGGAGGVSSFEGLRCAALDASIAARWVPRGACARRMDGRASRGECTEATRMISTPWQGL